MGYGMMGGPSGATDTAGAAAPVNAIGNWVSPESCVMYAEGAVGKPAPADAAAVCDLATLGNPVSARALDVFLCNSRDFGTLGLLLTASRASRGLFCAMRFKQGLGLASCKRGGVATREDIGGVALEGIELPVATFSDDDDTSLAEDAAGDHSREPVIEGVGIDFVLVPRSPSISIICRPSAEGDRRGCAEGMRDSIFCS